jgi:hypothetical protein
MEGLLGWAAAGETVGFGVPVDHSKHSGRQVEA